jgi:hypothetical protein
VQDECRHSATLCMTYSVLEMLVAWKQLPSNPVGCNCSNCMINVTYASMVEDFTGTHRVEGGCACVLAFLNGILLCCAGYTYNGVNTFELDVLDEICISQVVLWLAYRPSKILTKRQSSKVFWSC